MRCPFCAIALGQAPASLVAESERALAFMDQRQAVEGHVLVIPRRHVQDIYGIEPALAGEVMALAVRVAHAIRIALDPPGLNLWQSNGVAGGQEVPHFHVHVQPRAAGDRLLRVYPPDAPPPPAGRSGLDRLAATIGRHVAA